jgi:SNF2 family DNA or RNA helicase
VNFEVKTKLMSHQSDALISLCSIDTAALFMDMGTGKTLTCFSWLYERKEFFSKVVYFCPVSVKKTIKNQIEEHTTARCYVFDDKTSVGKIPSAEFYVVGIESMSSSNRVILSALSICDENTAIVCDESSYIKSHDSARTRNIMRCAQNTKYRMILNGTPLSNGFADLFSQLKFLSPKILGYHSFFSFAANHLEYSEKYPGLVVRCHNTKRLAERMKPFVFQVRKDDCLDLPEKIYSYRHYELSRQQKEYYKEAKEEFLAKFSEEDTIEVYDIFKLFIQLQQICSGFVKENGVIKDLAHGRIDLLLETIREIPNDKKIIIWAKYIHDIDAILSAIKEECGVDYCVEYSGRKTEKERNEQVKQFTEKARFFVGTQATGGHGLNELTCSHYTIFYNNNFKFGERLQTEDRQHRIGQTNNVTYIDLVASGTIDEKIMNALLKKENALLSFKEELDRVKKKSLKEAKKLMGEL